MEVKVLSQPEVRLAALLHPRLVLPTAEYQFALREIDQEFRGGRLGATGRQFLQTLLTEAVVAAAPVRWQDDPPEDDWPTPIGGSLINLQWHPIDPRSPFMSGFGGGKSDERSWWMQWQDYYDGLDEPPATVSESLVDARSQDDTQALKVFLEMRQADRAALCGAPWDEIAALATGDLMHPFRSKLKRALRSADPGSTMMAVEAAKALNAEINKIALAIPSEIDQQILNNRIDTFIGLLVGSVPLVGTLYTGAVGKVNDDDLRAKKARVEWIRAVAAIEELGTRRTAGS